MLVQPLWVSSSAGRQHSERSSGNLVQRVTSGWVFGEELLIFYLFASESFFVCMEVSS